jgi:hypothetical protein
MKITRMAILCLITVVLSFAPVLAQDHKEGEEHEELPQVEVVGGYSLLRSEGENLNGWKAAVSFNLNKWLAVAVDADGHYYSENSPEGRIKESEHSLTAGPHFALRNKSKLVPFAYVLGGVAWERRSLNGIGETESGFAFEPGGGLADTLPQSQSLPPVSCSNSERSSIFQRLRFQNQTRRGKGDENLAFPLF